MCSANTCVYEIYQLNKSFCKIFSACLYMGLLYTVPVFFCDPVASRCAGLKLDVRCCFLLGFSLI